VVRGKRFNHRGAQRGTEERRLQGLRLQATGKDKIKKGYRQEGYKLQEKTKTPTAWAAKPNRARKQAACYMEQQKDKGYGVRDTGKEKSFPRKSDFIRVNPCQNLFFIFCTMHHAPRTRIAARPMPYCGAR
jgi:hypothetical protein